MDDIQLVGGNYLHLPFDERGKTVFAHMLQRIRNPGKVDDVGIIVDELRGVAGKNIAFVSGLFKIVVQHRDRSGLTADP